jgi:hypothetical protein
MKLFETQQKPLACLLLLSFVVWMYATTFPVLAQEQTPDAQALRLIEASETLYQQESFEEALNKLGEAVGLAQSKEIKALGNLEMAYVKFLQGKRLLIFRFHIEEALKLNSAINIQEGNYKPGFLEAFQAIKSEVLKAEKPVVEKPLLEKTGGAKAQVKKKHFPWLGVILGLAVAGGLVYYFLIMKPTLQVDTTPQGAKVYLDGGDTAKVTPCQLETSTGSHMVRVSLEGYADVEREFKVKAGKNSLSIPLDIGTYTISAPAANTNVQREAPCTISWNSTAMAASAASPAAVRPLGVTSVDLELYQNESKVADIAKGVANSGSYTWNVPATTTEGYNFKIHIVSPAVSESHALGQAFNLLGFKEDFADNVANFWLPDNSATWTAASGYLTGSITGGRVSVNLYNFSYSGTSYTIESKMRWREFNGSGGSSPIFIMLGTSNSFTNNSGYAMGYGLDGTVGIYRIDGYNFITPPPGSPTTLWSASSTAVNLGLNNWNTLKIVRSGTSYSLYINNTLLRTMTLSDYNPTYIMIGFGCASIKTTCDFDYMYMTVNP